MLAAPFGLIDSIAKSNPGLVNQPLKQKKFSKDRNTNLILAGAWKGAKELGVPKIPS